MDYFPHRSTLSHSLHLIDSGDHLAAWLITNDDSSVKSKRQIYNYL